MRTKTRVFLDHVFSGGNDGMYCHVMELADAELDWCGEEEEEDEG